MRRIPILIFVLFGFLSSCGEITTNTNSVPAPSASPESSPPTMDFSGDLNHPTGNTVIVLGANFTDPIGTLNLIPLAPPRTSALNLQITHSDAVVRSFGNKLYVVNRLGGDNIQVVDPNNGFRVETQFTTGRGTNPQEFIAVSPTKGYVTLYQPEDNRDDGFVVDDLMIVNPQTGTILKNIDLTPFTAGDGDRFARASSMVIVENRLFVALQDLPDDLSLPPNQPGKIVEINTETDAITGLLVLQGHNPVAMTYSPVTGKIYVAMADFFNLATPYGGVEVVDPASLTSMGIRVPDEALGGAPGDIDVSGEKGFVTAGFEVSETTYATKLVSFDLATLETGEDPRITEVYTSDAYIQEIAVAEDGLLVVGDRDPAVSGILLIDPVTESTVAGPIPTGLPPSSITFVER